MESCHALEACLVALNATFIATLIATLGTIWIVDGGPGQPGFNVPSWTFAPILIALLVLIEGPYLYRVWWFIRRRTWPIGPAVIGRFRSAPFPINLTLSMWWVAHFLLCLIMIPVFHRIADDDPTAIPFVLLGSVGIGVAGNVYLVLAVKYLTISDRAALFVWRHRFLVDTVVVIGVTAAEVGWRLGAFS